jgi:hypothetical protein
MGCCPLVGTILVDGKIHHMSLIRDPNPRLLSFGALAAEREIENLKAYFVESEAFKNLRDGKKSVALGNRGSGKSAIFKMIAEHARPREIIQFCTLAQEKAVEQNRRLPLNYKTISEAEHSSRLDLEVSFRSSGSGGRQGARPRARRA